MVLEITKPMRIAHKHTRCWETSNGVLSHRRFPSAPEPYRRIRSRQQKNARYDSQRVQQRTPGPTRGKEIEDAMILLRQK